MITRTFEKINDIFQYKLILENGGEFTIPLREDGYVHATGLCKAVGKKVNHWLSLKQTKDLQKELETKLKKSDTVPPATKLIEIHQAGNKYNQGTWIHPDLGLNLAQWCSPSFSLQVSKWLRELIFTGTVEIEKEKSDEEIDNKYQEIIKELEETKEKLENAEDLIEKYDNINKDLSKKYNKINLNHQYYLRRKELYKLRRGNSVYLIDMKIAYGDEDSTRIKIGNSSDITMRISGFRTGNPFCKVLFVMYTYNSEIIEKSMKTKYEKYLKPNNSEFITDIDVETLKNDIITIATMLNSEYTLETEEELNKFNKHIIAEDEVEEIKDNEIVDGIKRCGGLHHDTEESRLLPISEYFKNKGNPDGYARLCKECYLIGVYGDKRKKRKVIVIPEFDATTHKWCNLCESIKEHKDFYSDKSKKDGLNPNCKDCKNIQKKNYRQKLKEEEKDLENNNEKEDITDNEEEFDKNIFDENFADKYTKYDLTKIADNNNLKFTKNHTRAELIHIIKENNTLDPLEKLTKNKLMKLATNKKIKITHHYTKPEIINLINSLTPL